MITAGRKRRRKCMYKKKLKKRKRINKREKKLQKRGRWSSTRQVEDDEVETG